MAVNQITFTVTGTPGSQTLSNIVITGPVPNGPYTIDVGIDPTSNSYEVAIISPIGTAEESNFQEGSI